LYIPHLIEQNERFVKSFQAFSALILKIVVQTGRFFLGGTVPKMFCIKAFVSNKRDKMLLSPVTNRSINTLIKPCEELAKDCFPASFFVANGGKQGKLGETFFSF